MAGMGIFRGNWALSKYVRYTVLLKPSLAEDQLLRLRQSDLTPYSYPFQHLGAFANPSFLVLQKEKCP